MPQGIPFTRTRKVKTAQMGGSLWCAGGENRPTFVSVICLTTLAITGPTSSLDSSALVYRTLFSILQPVVKQNHPDLQSGIICFMCGWGESNSRPLLGRQLLYHLTTPAIMMYSVRLVLSLCFIYCLSDQADVLLFIFALNYTSIDVLYD